tara:strand:- start:86 stop:436 length:351 start_codon:yes stop_codon:yes gene_type:complete
VVGVTFVGRLSARCDFVVVVDFVERVVVGASVASPKQRMGLRTFGERVADVIDDGVGVAAGRTAGRLALGETPPPRRLKEGEQSPVASVPSSSLLLVVDDTPVVVVVVAVAPSRTD